jgi:hypothetical protein
VVWVPPYPGVFIIYYNGYPGALPKNYRRIFYGKFLVSGGVSPFWGWPGVCVPVLILGVRVDASPFWGWPGWCGPVLGVTGWMYPRFGGGRVGTVPCWGWPGGYGSVLGVVVCVCSRVGGDRVDVSPCWG